MNLSQHTAVAKSHILFKYYDKRCKEFKTREISADGVRKILFSVWVELVFLTPSADICGCVNVEMSVSVFTSVPGSSWASERRRPAPQGTRTCSHCNAASDPTSPTVYCYRCLETPPPESHGGSIPPAHTHTRTSGVVQGWTEVGFALMNRRTLMNSVSVL